MWKYSRNQHNIVIILQLKINKLRKKKEFWSIVVAKMDAGEGGTDWEFGISRYKLLYIGRLDNKVLRYSTENHIQYPVINHNGKENEKGCLYN